MLVGTVPSFQHRLNAVHHSLVADVNAVAAVMPVQQIRKGDNRHDDERLALKVRPGVVKALHRMKNCLPRLHQQLVAAEMEPVVGSICGQAARNSASDAWLAAPTPLCFL